MPKNQNTRSEIDLSQLERDQKLDLIQRSLGIRHKLKVHESMKPAETHEDMALTYLTQWELEDELHAIEELLGEVRMQNVREKKHQILRDGVKVKHAEKKK